jgi:hypothetical protein
LKNFLINKSLFLLERFSFNVFDTGRLFWLDDDRMFSDYLDFLHPSNARIFLQQFSGRSSSVSAFPYYDVLSSSEVRKRLTALRHIIYSTIFQQHHKVSGQFDKFTDDMRHDEARKHNAS